MKLPPIPETSIVFDNDGICIGVISDDKLYEYMENAAKHQAVTYLAGLGDKQLRKVDVDLDSLTEAELRYIANICPAGWEEDRAWVMDVISNWNYLKFESLDTDAARRKGREERLAVTFWARAAIKAMGLE